MQRFGVLYQEISHECLVFSKYTHDEPSGHAIGYRVAIITEQIRHMQSALWGGCTYKYRVEYEAAFLYSDWLYFLWHGI